MLLVPPLPRPEASAHYSRIRTADHLDGTTVWRCDRLEISTPSFPKDTCASFFFQSHELLYYSMPMPAVNVSTARGQKRKRSPEVDPESTPPPEPQWKRAGFRSAEEANTAFWDNLSTVPLFPRALKELDRRNWLSVGPTTKSVARSAGPTTRPATRRAAQVNQLGRQRSTVLEDRAAQLKRFARRGGPDLHDLRGVCIP